MVINDHKIRNLLKFDSSDDFYFLQILKRRKDNPGMERDMVVIEDIFIYSLEDFDKKLPYVIETCDHHNARAYIRVNRRSLKKTAQEMLLQLTEYVVSENEGNYKAARSLYSSIAGLYHNESPKRWIVDLDNDKGMTIEEASNVINSLEPVGHKIIEVLPTKNGHHIICTPFNLDSWRKLIKFPIDVHKDNPTLLYVPGEKPYIPCGGCGADHPDQRCLGCFHQFTKNTATL